MECVKKFLFQHRDTTLAAVTTAVGIPVLQKLSPTGLTLVQVCSVAEQLGMQCWVSFVAGPTMFSIMERKDFAFVQGNLFPKYGLIESVFGTLGLAAWMLRHPDESLLAPTLPLALLVGSLKLSALNTFVLFPLQIKLQKQMFELPEDSEERKKLRKKFGMFHGISMLVNFGTMITNCGFLYVFASKIAEAW